MILLDEDISSGSPTKSMILMPYRPPAQISCKHYVSSANCFDISPTAPMPGLIDRSSFD